MHLRRTLVLSALAVATTVAAFSQVLPKTAERPVTDAVRQRVKVLGSSPQPRWTGLAHRPGVLFALKYQPPLNQPLIVTMGPSAVFEVATGKELPDRIPQANGGTAGGGSRVGSRVARSSTRVTRIPVNALTPI